MYKVEIFSDKMEFVSVAFAIAAQTIDLDYLSYNPYSIQTGLVDCKKGYFVHITSVEDNRYVADGIISDVQPDKYTQKISIRPLQALFDADICSTKITDCVTWIKDAITSIFIKNADSLQNRPIKLTCTKPSDDLPLTESFDEKQDDTFNILSVISAALKHYNVVTACYLDMKNMRIRVRIYQNKETKTIEGDLENVINSSATLGDSYGSINKVVVRRFMNLGSGYLRCYTPEASLAKTVDVGEEFALDTNGYYTIQFSEKVKANSKIDFIDESKSGECATAEGTLEKTVTIKGYDPSDGYLWVIFKSPVPTGSTLKVNNKTAYPIYKDGAPIPSGTIPVDYPAYLAFDGSHYIYAKTNVPIYVNGRAVHDDEIPPEKICLFQFNGTQLGFVKAYPEDTEESLLIGYLSYFRGINGKIGTNIKTSNRIVPVFVKHISIEQPSDLSYANWKKEALLQSAEILTPEQYDQEIAQQLDDFFERLVFDRIKRHRHVDVLLLAVEDHRTEENDAREEVLRQLLRPRQRLLEDIAVDDLRENQRHHARHEEDERDVRDLRNQIVDRFQQFQHKKPPCKNRVKSQGNGTRTPRCPERYLAVKGAELIY